MSVLTAGEFNIAFEFARSEAAQVRGSDGVPISAPANTPRFDHGADGSPRGLLVARGAELGGQDRVTLDALMLPVELVESDSLDLRAATVYHAFVPFQPEERSADEFAKAVTRRAIYTREAKRTIDALLKQEGHHLSIGVHSGFAPNQDGFVRYRGALWQLPSGLSADGGSIEARPGAPLLTSGAELLI